MCTIRKNTFQWITENNNVDQVDSTNEKNK